MYRDADKVFIRWHMQGKHTGEMLGVPGTNKEVSLHRHDLLRIEGGKIVELWHIEQLLQVVGQMRG